MSFLSKLFKKPTSYDGLFPDPRSKQEKNKDYEAVEVIPYGVATSLPTFREVKENDWKKYQIRNQDGSGSCVANTVAKMLEVKYTLKVMQDACNLNLTPLQTLEKSIKFSHAPIYINRQNKPYSGMWGQDALQLGVKYSSCKEVDFPSENMNDAQLDALKMPENYESLNNFIKPNSYLVLPLNFDYVASIIEKEGSAMIWVDTSYNAWVRDIPVVGGKGGGVRHSITGVDTITLGGVKYIVIEDSWGSFGKYNGQRLLTREFFDDSVIYAAAFTDFIFNIKDNSSEENLKTLKLLPFKTVMSLGQKNTEIVRLQQVLQVLGFFPTNQNRTGYYGNITAKAVDSFQRHYKVAPIEELDLLNGRRVGQKTLSFINTLL